MSPRGWCPKFATGLNIIIGCSSKSIWVTRLLFCQNDYPMRGSFWYKDSLITLILFELQPIMIFSPVANFGHHPLGINSEKQMALPNVAWNNICFKVWTKIDFLSLKVKLAVKFWFKRNFKKHGLIIIVLYRKSLSLRPRRKCGPAAEVLAASSPPPTTLEVGLTLWPVSTCFQVQYIA